MSEPQWNGASLDSEGLHSGAPNTIAVWSGRKVDPLNLQPEDVTIVDIAHSLARQNRYAGHNEGFLSVARHSILASEHLEHTGHPEHALWGLLHDSAEAYLVDVPRPLKQHPAMSFYLEAEAHAEAVIAQVFDLPYPMPQEVKDADRFVLLDLELSAGGLRETYFGDYRQDERDFLAAYARLTGGSPYTDVTGGLIIGLSGYARSGKDTVASFLGLRGYKRLAFADKLRDVLYALDPIVETMLGDPMWHIPVPASLQPLVKRYGWDMAKDSIPENPYSVRSLLQRLGTEAGREILGQDVWVNAAMQSLDPVKRYVFTDVRFPNEYHAIRATGGEVWRITRPGTEPVNPHVSETALDDFDFDRTIGNAGDINDLRTLILSLVDAR